MKNQAVGGLSDSCIRDNCLECLPIRPLGSTVEMSAAPDLDNLQQLSLQERAYAKWQRVCPVTRAPLGSMGELSRVDFQGRCLFLCCEACVDQVVGGRVIKDRKRGNIPESDEAGEVGDR